MFRSLSTLAALIALLVGQIASAAPFAYIPSQNSNQVEVIDTATNSVVATIPVGLQPLGVAVHPSGHFVYIGNDGDGTVSVIDTAIQSVTTTIPVGPNPQGIAVNPAGTFAYVVIGPDNSVLVIDTATNAVVATIPVGNGPKGVAVDHTGSFIYVANGGGTVSVIDAATNAVVATIPAGAFTFGIAANPAAAFVYASNVDDNSVSVIDSNARTVVATVPVGVNPWNLAVNPAGTYVYVPNSGNNNVSVISTVSNTVVATVPVGNFPVGISVHPSGNLVYVVNEADQSVSVIDAAANAVTAAVPISGVAPAAFGKFIGPLTMACATPPADMISWWPGDGNANDIVGTNNATMVGGAAFGSGVVAQGFTFSGSGSYVTIPDSASLDFSGPLSIDAWIKPNSVAGNHRIVGKGGWNPHESFILVLVGDRLRFGLAAPNGSSTEIDTTQTIAAGVWTHLTATFDGSTMRMYVNGVLDSTVGSHGAIGTGSSVAWIGVSPDGPATEPFDGLIDEVELFGRALTAAEVEAIFDAGIGGKCKGTAPAITSAAPPSGTFGVSYSYTYTASGSPAPTFSVSSGTLPTGLALNGTTGVVSGAPSATGTFTGAVTATNAIGIATQGFSITIAANVPGAPMIGTATAGNLQASVSFAPPASNGGSAITSYKATSNPGGFDASGAASPITVAGLTNGTAYTFTVTATNAVGTSAPSAASNAVTPKSPTSTAISTIKPEPSLTGQPYVVAVKVTAVMSVANGSVVVNDGLGSSCTIASLSSGAGSCSLASMAAGPRTITAAYSGSTAFLGSTGTRVHAVNPANTKTSLSSTPNPSVLGSPVTFTATVSASGMGAGIPTGTVTFTIGNATLGTATLNSSGNAIFTTSALPRGKSAVVANYGGSANYNNSKSAPVNQSVK